MTHPSVTFETADDLLQLILETLKLNPNDRAGYEGLIREYGDFRVQESQELMPEGAD